MKRPATETAYVLMADRVGYSSVPLERRAILDRELRDSVVACPAVVEAGSSCLRLDSGDGLALVFFTDPVNALEAAIYLQENVADASDVKLRIGLHSGLVSRREDASNRENVSGPGIDKAQRAMSLSDGSRLVMSEFFAENLRAFEAWAGRLEDLGSHPTKNGDSLHIFGLAGSLAKPVTARAPETKVAIIYRRKAEPDSQLLAELERKLPDRGMAIFVDRHLAVGVEWAQEIEREIRGADAVVVLLSGKAAVSEMVLFEVQIAVGQMEQTGKPRVLPIRIGEDAPVEGEIGTLLNRFQYVVWRGPEDNARVIAALSQVLVEPRSIAPVVTSLERVGGAMRTDSPYYLVRSTDRDFQQALLERDSIVLVKGGRQIGKTSLMARALREASKAGSRIVWTDLQAFSTSQIETDERLYVTMATEFAAQLELEDDPVDSWKSMLGPNTNFERFIQNGVLKKIGAPVIWAMDEVDRLFTMPYSSDFFGMIRSWHNRRAARSEETWSRFTVALAYATEAHLFISDLNQSPFNVGTRLELADFNLDQVEELNAKYGGPLVSEDQLIRFHQLVGGQPYLTRRGLDEMVRNHTSFTQIEERAAFDEGPFGDHLRRLLVALSGDPKLFEEARALAEGRGLSNEEVFFRLRSGGLVRGTHLSDAQFRCEIYAKFLSAHL